MILPDRVIEVPGTGLLPPVYEPQIPARMRGDERVRVIPPSPPWGVRNAADVSAPFDDVSSKDQRYWFLRDAYKRELPHGLEWAERPGPGRWGDGLGLDLLANGTTFRFSAPASLIKLPSMWEPFGAVAMVVSRRLLDVLRALDADAIVSRTLVIRGRDNELVSDEYAIVDVVRNLAAIDIANSIIDYHRLSWTKRWAPTPSFWLRFEPYTRRPRRGSCNFPSTKFHQQRRQNGDRQREGSPSAK